MPESTRYRGPERSGPAGGAKPEQSASAGMSSANISGLDWTSARLRRHELAPKPLRSCGRASSLYMTMPSLDSACLTCAARCAAAAVVPGVLHRTGRYRTNGIERDHGFLKERLRPMRGLKSSRSTAVFVVGHALVRNIWCGFYRIAQAPKRLMLAWSWTRLAEAV